MNAPLRRVAISVLVLFTLLIINVNVIQVVRAKSLRENPSNTRVLAEEYDRQRGSIVVGGDNIAVSVKTDDRLTYLRQYPQGPTYAHVTGYYSLVAGTTGMERAENDVLTGSDPRLVLRRLADLFTGRDPAGGDVVLTLDATTQQTAADALQGLTGSVVALDPQTGKILAMASTPTFDPNQLTSHDPQAIRAYRATLSDAELVNHAIADRYSPGSVFKVIVAAAALSNGYSPSTTVPAPDLLTLPGTSTTLENYNGESCNGGADQSLVEALTISCNTAFAELGITLGEQKVRDMAEAFGLDDTESQIPLRVAASTVGAIDNEAELGVASIGQQNVQISPLEGAMIAATVANDGTQMKPYLVDQLRAPDLTVVDQTEPEERSKPISASVAGELTEMMTSVVEKGTGKRAAIDGYQVAGKTGTAETGIAADNAWFVGFARPEDGAKGRQIAVAVFIKGGGTGGDKSAPIARQVMEAYLAGQGGN